MTDDKSGEGDLAARIARAREELEPKRGPNVAEKYNALSVAWRMVLELVVGTGIGVAVGWSLDELFATKPIFVIAIGLLGFAAGVKTVIATANEVSRMGSGSGERDDAADK